MARRGRKKGFAAAFTVRGVQAIAEIRCFRRRSAVGSVVRSVVRSVVVDDRVNGRRADPALGFRNRFPVVLANVAEGHAWFRPS